MTPNSKQPVGDALPMLELAEALELVEHPEHEPQLYRVLEMLLDEQLVA